MTRGWSPSAHAMVLPALAATIAMILPAATIAMVLPAAAIADYKKWRTFA